MNELSTDLSTAIFAVLGIMLISKLVVAAMRRHHERSFELPFDGVDEPTSNVRRIP